MINKLKSDIREMKTKVDKVIVLWTANTEQFLLPEILTIEDLSRSIASNIPLPASVLYCVACIDEHVLYLNGSP